MKITFIGACHEVTGSATYLEACGKHILFDYGLEQGRDFYENAPLPVAEEQIDYVFLSHAHVDHSGMLPHLYAQGFRGKIFATEATSDLCGIMLRDCAYIQLQETEWKNRKAKRSGGEMPFAPLFTMADADATIKLFVPCPYGEKIEVAEGLSIRFTDIGQLLGSASIEAWLSEDGTERLLVYSGDIGNLDQPLIKNPTYTEKADYVIMESTYGDRHHPADRLDYVTELAKIIQTTFDKGGNLVIPSFAVGRTQEILYFLRKIKEQKLVVGHAGFRVYVDSPLAVEATGIFSRNTLTCFDDEARALIDKGVNPISFPGLRLSITSEESREINEVAEPKVIISASGMCEAGRIRHHLKHNLWRKDSTVLFVGYQAGGTLGRALYEGASQVKLFGEVICVNASIKTLPGLSGHADKDGLTKWLDGFDEKPSKVFIVHGDDRVTDAFAAHITDTCVINACAPFSGTRFDLVSGEFEFEATGVPVISKGRTVAADIFARLVEAGKRLMAIISRSEGRANKDIVKLTNKINKLCDEYDI